MFQYGKCLTAPPDALPGAIGGMGVRVLGVLAVSIHPFSEVSVGLMSGRARGFEFEMSHERGKEELVAHQDELDRERP